MTDPPAGDRSASGRTTRRRLLTALSGVGALGVAGCASRPPVATDDGDGDGGQNATADGPTGSNAGTAEDVPIARQGVPPDVCSEPVQSDPGIYAVVDPAFDRTWADRRIDPLYLSDGRRSGGLAEEDVVVGVVAGDRARAYPLAVLYHHEVVNDDLAGPLLVTYCPLCNSGLVADRRIDGRAARFLVSGLLWKPPKIRSAAAAERGEVFGASPDDPGADLRSRGNLVMYDRPTGSYWSQAIARAICGPRTGERLSIRPSTTATWGEWRREHPDGEVLLPPPYSRTTRPPE